MIDTAQAFKFYVVLFELLGRFFSLESIIPSEILHFLDTWLVWVRPSDS